VGTLLVRAAIISPCLAVALHLRPHCGRTSPPAALGAAQAPHHIRQQRIPSRERCEGSRLRRSTVATCARENQNVLAEVVGEADNGQRLARWHHPPIVARRPAARPSSAGAASILYAAYRGLGVRGCCGGIPCFARSSCVGAVGNALLGIAGGFLSSDIACHPWFEITRIHVGYL
jgi:hypothetical protein